MTSVITVTTTSVSVGIVKLPSSENGNKNKHSAVHGVDLHQPPPRHKVASLDQHKPDTPKKFGAVMIHRLCVAMLVSAFALIQGASAQTRSEPALDAHGNLNSLIARHAAANNLPEELVRRVIKRESRGNARAISKGNYGLMQIRLGTARALGYRGDVAGLLDADTNMTYAVKYLAGAYRVAGGNHDRAVRYYAAGYYYAAKRQRGQPLNIFAAASTANASAPEVAAATPASAVGPATTASNDDDEPVEASPTALSAIK